jgi:acyl phosphate:glycerol-3-phosphate acyltransferase
MPTGVQVALILIASYLIGALPFSVIVGRLFYRVDVRQHGSGNAGATNVYRVLGARAAVAVLVLDMLKGVVAACLALLWAPEQFGATGQDWCS